MLSYPDFSEKQILYITNEQIRGLKIKNDNLAIYEDDALINQVSLTKIFCIFLIGDATLTTVLVRKCMDYGVCVFCMKDSYLVYATIGAQTEGNTILRKVQYRSEKSSLYACQIVRNKIANQRMSLSKIRNKTTKTKSAIQTCDDQIGKIVDTIDMKELLGREGNAGKAYFGAMFEEYEWRMRAPRAKIDITNFLLDMGYTFLFNFVEANARLYGFDLYQGVYHTEFYMRKSLICDLIEPFRCIIDRAMIRSYGLGMIQKKDFTYRQDKYTLDWKHQRKYAKIFLEAIMDYKEDIFRYIQGYYRAVIKSDDIIPPFIMR